MNLTSTKYFIQYIYLLLHLLRLEIGSTISLSTRSFIFVATMIIITTSCNVYLESMSISNVLSDNWLNYSCRLDWRSKKKNELSWKRLIWLKWNKTDGRMGEMNTEPGQSDGEENYLNKYSRYQNLLILSWNKTQPNVEISFNKEAYNWSSVPDPH